MTKQIMQELVDAARKVVGGFDYLAGAPMSPKAPCVADLREVVSRAERRLAEAELCPCGRHELSGGV